jgi:hypothetical protein
MSEPNPELRAREQAEREMRAHGAGSGTYVLLALVTLVPAAGVAFYLRNKWGTEDFRAEATIWLTVLLLSELLAGLLLVARWFQRLTTNSDIEELRKVAFSYRLGGTLSLRPFLNEDGEHLHQWSRLADYRKGIIEPNFFKTSTNPPFCLALIIVISLGLFAFYAPSLNIFQMPIVPLLGSKLAGWDWTPGAAVAEEMVAYGVSAVVCLAFAFAGALVWAVIYLTRRMSLRDVTAYTYQEVSMRLIVSAIVALVAYHVLGSTNVLSGEQLMFVSFGAGIMPETLLRWLSNKISRWFGTVEQNNAIDLEHVQGINAFTRARLAEVGVYDAQGLVTSNPLRLCLHTPYSLPQIVDWYGQAFLLLHARPSGLMSLRDHGVRTVWELLATSAMPASQLSLPPESSVTQTLPRLEAMLRADQNFVRVDQIQERMRNIEAEPRDPLRLAAE